MFIMSRMEEVMKNIMEVMTMVTNQVDMALVSEVFLVDS
jgi:hypothetical protein